MNGRAVVYAHQPCPDGFVASTILAVWLRSKGYHVEVVGLAPGTPGFAPRATDVASRPAMFVFVDICPVVEALRAFVDLVGVEDVIVLDHHPGARDVIAEHARAQSTPGRSGLRSVWSGTEAASVLVWRAVHPAEPMPLLVQYVSDRDTGSYSMPGCVEVTLSLNARGVFAPGGEAELAWLLVAQPADWLAPTMAHGEVLRRLLTAVCEAEAKHAQVGLWQLPDSSMVRVARATVADFTHMTPVADAIAKDGRGVSCVLFAAPCKDGLRVSVRACGQYDVRTVCAAYPGGGGYAGAGSFTLDAEAYALAFVPLSG